jgi:hypothetical protein
MGEAIIFLDFDGVICSPRAHVAQGKRWVGPEYSGIRWADPVACDLVLHLLEKHQAKLVISSTWRTMESRCRQVLGRYRLDRHLHEDWRTGEDPKRYRGNEVREWLEAHGRPPYVILDDDSDFDEDQKGHLILTDGLNGMLFDKFRAADALLSRLLLVPSEELDGGGNG